MLRTVRNVRRLVHAANVLARHDALIPREYSDKIPRGLKLLRIFFARARSSDLGTPAGERLAHALESLGPAYIKLGQILATRPDVIGDEVAVALESLQDRLPPFATWRARAEIEAGLGRPLGEI